MQLLEAVTGGGKSLDDRDVALKDFNPNTY
jgi:hypothetical protein